MSYKVIIQPRASRDLDEAYQCLSGRYSIKTATKWYNGILEGMHSLSENPQRFGYSRENRAFEADIRQLLYHHHKNVHRILFTIDGSTVRILCIRHSAQRDVNPDDLASQ